MWAVLASGAVLTAWALQLHASVLEIAALQALATGGQVLHGPAGFLTAWLGRRRVAIVALTGARLVWLPLALAPLLDVSDGHARVLLFAVAAISSVLQVVGSNAWSVWMGDLVPALIRGRFFGARTAFATAGSAAAALACAALLDAGPSVQRVALAALAALLFASGLWSASLLVKQVDVRAPAAEPPSLRGYAMALRDPRARPLLLYQLAWGFAIAPGAAFFSLYVLEDCEGTFALLAVHAVVMAIVRVLTVPFWGATVDRFGPRPVLIVCSVAIGSTPLLWISCGPEFLWPLALDAVVAGFLWGGHAIASFDLPLDIAPPEKRPYYLALFATALGVGFAASSFAAGFYADALSSGGRAPLPTLFVLSSIARVLSGLLATRIAKSGGAGTRDVLAHALQTFTPFRWR